MRITLVATLSYVQFIIHSSKDISFREYPFPLGLLVVAGVLEELGHTVTIVDPNWVTAEFQLQDHILVYRKVIDSIIGSQPDLVGFTTMCDSYHHTLSLAKQLRKYLKIPILLGGPQATAVDVDTLKNFPCIDFVLRGEVENVIHHFINAFEGRVDFTKVPNLTFRDSLGTAHRNPDAPLISDLDLFPPPAFHHYKNFSGNVQIFPIEAGRGCPFNCKFCSTALFFKRTYRLKSGKRIRNEIEDLECLFGKDLRYRFIHDMLTVNKRLIAKMCEDLVKMEPRRLWSCSARVDTITKELIQLMADAGCNEIYFGIESGSANLQRKIGKNLKLGQVLPRVRNAPECGIDVTLSFMSGFPEEQKEDLDATLTLIFDCIRECGSTVKIQMHLLAPYVGTQLYNDYADILQFDGYFSDQTGQPIMDSSLEMILKYPKLFSNFYFVPQKHYSRDLLFGLDTFVYIILSGYPLTILTLQMWNGSALDFFQRWQQKVLKYIHPKKLTATQVDPELAYRGVNDIIEEFSEKFPKFKTLFNSIWLYEQALLSEPTYIKTGACFFPTLDPRVKLFLSPLNIPELREQIYKQKRPLPPERHDVNYYAIRYLSNRTTETLSLSRLIYEVINSCNGMRSWSGIVERLLVSFPNKPRDELEIAGKNAIRTAIEYGLVCKELQ